jgi:hypothetical protein
MRIQLDREQTIKFLSCFIDDARRIVIERKQAAQQVTKPITKPKEGTAS